MIELLAITDDPQPLRDEYFRDWHAKNDARLAINREAPADGPPQPKTEVRLIDNDPAAWQPKARGTVPTGVAVSLTQDVAVRRLAERDHNVVHWSEFDRGGHFPAMEVPDLLADDIRAFFAELG